MCQADVVMWSGKELQTPSVCQLGVRPCGPLSLNDLSLSLYRKQGEVFTFCNNIKLYSFDWVIHYAHGFPYVLLAC